MATSATQILRDGFDRVAQSVPEVADGLAPEDLAWRPAGGANSIGWLLWHLARVEDAQVAPIGDRDQVWHTGGWSERASLPYPSDATGYGMDDEEVGSFRDTDASVIVGYYAAVHDATAAVLDELTGDDALDRVIDENWDPPVTVGVRLVSVLDDVARHVGQAEYVRGLLDRQLTTTG